MLSNIKAARALGWVSIGLGLTEIAVPGWVEQQLGVKGHRGIIRGFGLREIAAGMMILNQPGLNRNLVAGLWSRVGGDAVDLAALGKAKDSTRRPEGLGTVSAIVTAITGIDILVALKAHFDLIHTHQVSHAARRRWNPVPATPNGRLPGDAPKRPQPDMALVGTET